MAIIKKQEITSVGEDTEQLEPLGIAGGMKNGTATVEDGITVPQEVKHRLTTWLSNFTSRYRPRSESRHSVFVHQYSEQHDS